MEEPKDGFSYLLCYRKSSLLLFLLHTGHLETLSWSVELSLTDTELDDLPQTYIEDIVENVASKVGLVNHGQIGHLRGHFLLSHSQHHHHEQNKTILTNDNVLQYDKSSLPDHWHLRQMQRKQWNELKETVDSLLDINSHVLRYTQQVVRPR